MSAIKYNLTFTGTAEVLFGILAKLVPSDDLHIHVEEVGAPEPHMGTRAEWLAKRVHDPAIQFDEKFDAPKVRRHKRYATRKPPRPMDLNKGINKIILDTLAQGMGRHVNEIKHHLKDGGYSPNSFGSRIEHLRRHGVVEKLAPGVWRLTEKHVANLP